MLVDSHCHLNMLDLADFAGSLDNVILEARRADVTKMLCVCVELEDFTTLKKIAEKYDNIYISVGVHPNDLIKQQPSVESLVELGQYKKCIALGETGLDYYRDESEVNKITQQLGFRNHINAAKELKKSLIIHTRHAATDTLQMMRSEDAGVVGGVMHCFAEEWEVAKQALDLGFYISFSGIVTFKNATKIHEVVKKVPLDRLLVETDAPYLAPVPFRGKQNHPALVQYVAKAIAEMRGIDYLNLANVTTTNFHRCFGLDVT
jgi:TatD DNase family protein